ncbi:RT0821/Lpp0805 family surface protein [Alsobacter sp. R-9]
MAGASVLAVLSGLSLSACSMTFPIGPLAEPETTGSIVAAPLPVLSADLSGEDLVFAEDAMSTALDPLRRTTVPARWTNPSTGRNGSFLAVGEAFVRQDEVCRFFKANVSLDAGPQQMSGFACRTGAGPWQLRKIKPETA